MRQGAAATPTMKGATKSSRTTVMPRASSSFMVGSMLYSGRTRGTLSSLSGTCSPAASAELAGPAVVVQRGGCAPPQLLECSASQTMDDRSARSSRGREIGLKGGERALLHFSEIPRSVMNFGCPVFVGRVGIFPLGEKNHITKNIAKTRETITKRALIRVCCQLLFGYAM